MPFVVVLLNESSIIVAAVTGSEWTLKSTLTNHWSCTEIQLVILILLGNLSQYLNNAQKCSSDLYGMYLYTFL